MVCEWNACFCLITFMEHDVVFPSIVVKFMTAGFNGERSSFATQSVAFFRDCSFRSWVWSSVSSSPTVCVREELLFLCNISEICCHPNVCSLYILPDFWDRYSPWLSVLISGESQLLCWLSRPCLLFWSQTATHSNMRSTALVELLSSGRIAWLFF